MKSFKEISIGIFIFCIILFIIQLILTRSIEKECKKKDVVELEDNLKKHGLNKPEHFQIARYVKEEVHKKRNPTLQGMIKQVINGVIRGTLTGVLINGLEGAVTGAVIFGVLTPLMSCTDFLM